MIFFMFCSVLSDSVYLDPKAPIGDRVRDLLSQMTIEEKIGQLQQVDGRHGIEEPFEEQHPGSYLSILLDNAATAIKISQTSRLKIPTIVGIDSIHGYGFYPGATVFPSQLGAACTWDEVIIEMMGNVTAFEMRFSGVHWTFAPVLGVARELRWGRVDETFGEDPLLIGRFGSAMIRGLQ
jgi:beta-glucosidase